MTILLIVHKLRALKATPERAAPMSKQSIFHFISFLYLVSLCSSTFAESIFSNFPDPRNGAAVQNPIDTTLCITLGWPYVAGQIGCFVVRYAPVAVEIMGNEAARKATSTDIQKSLDKLSYCDAVEKTTEFATSWFA